MYQIHFMDHDALMFFLKLKSQSPFAFAVKKKKKDLLLHSTEPKKKCFKKQGE